MSKLREAAQAVSTMSHRDDPRLLDAILALRAVLAEPEEDGWRRCAVGQGETQHCALLEAAVLAEREACAQILDSVSHDNPMTANDCADAIRARGQE